MRLAYGRQGVHLIHVSEVERGQDGLLCPYCNAELVAKKGKLMAHHFAHRKESCWQSGTYDFFGLKQKLPIHLSLSDHAHYTYVTYLKHRRSLEEKHIYYQQRQHQDQEAIRQFYSYLKQQPNANHDLLRIYLVDEFAPLPNFNYPKKIYFALKNYHSQRHQLQELKTKLGYFQIDADRFKKFALYFLKVQVGTQAIFYKIGITARSLPLRLTEIERDLKWYFPQLTIHVLMVLPNAAFLENFFKQKYMHRRYELAQFTEYFQLLPHEVDQIGHELQQIQKSSSYQSFSS
jgi:hypothetical protein